MKLLSQLITLYLPGVTMLQVMITIGAVLVFGRTVTNKFSISYKNWIIRRRTRAMENNMWTIE